jgi:hypothetical protein
MINGVKVKGKPGGNMYGTNEMNNDEDDGGEEKRRHMYKTNEFNNDEDDGDDGGRGKEEAHAWDE